MNVFLPVAAQREALLVVKSKDGTEGQEHWKKTRQVNIFNFDPTCTFTSSKKAIIKNPSIGIC